MYLTQCICGRHLIKGSDKEGIIQLKQYFAQKFQIKDLEYLRFFLGVEVAQSKNGLVIS